MLIPTPNIPLLNPEAVREAWAAYVAGRPIPQAPPAEEPVELDEPCEFCGHQAAHVHKEHYQAGRVRECREPFCLCDGEPYRSFAQVLVQSHE